MQDRRRVSDTLRRVKEVNLDVSDGRGSVSTDAWISIISTQCYEGLGVRWEHAATTPKLGVEIDRLQHASQYRPIRSTNEGGR